MCPRDIEVYLSAVFLCLAAALPHHNICKGRQALGYLIYILIYSVCLGIGILAFTDSKTPKIFFITLFICEAFI